MLSRDQLKAEGNASAMVRAERYWGEIRGSLAKPRGLGSGNEVITEVVICSERALG